MKNWTYYFKNTKDLPKKYRRELPSGNDPEVRKARNEMARYILKHMKGKDNDT